MIQTWVSRIAPWAKGRCQTTAPPRDPLFLKFRGPSTLFSTVVVHFRMPTRSVRGLRFSIASPTSVVSCVVNFSHSDGCQVTSYHGFGLHFPDDGSCWVSVHESGGHLDVLSETKSIHLFCPSVVG